ncbi:hypothetical protein [Burkholderia sp. Ed8]|uniref:hypothetical protein n=1 Tax=Burkholderia sp. Ed8 TaxID=3112957 RepID=UPI00345DF9E8
MSNLQDAAAVQSVTRTFIDLREFVRDRSQGIPLSASSGQDSFLASRRLLNFPSGPVTAGSIALEAGSGTVECQPADELITIRDGTLTQQDHTLVLGPEMSAVIQHGAKFSWSAEGDRYR